MKLDMLSRPVLAALVLGSALVIRQPAAAQQVAWTPAAVQARAIYWADTYGVSEGWMIGVFDCESHFDPYQIGAHGEIGVGQWLPSTWQAYASGDISDVDANIRETVRAHADGLAGMWSCG